MAHSGEQEIKQMIEEAEAAYELRLKSKQNTDEMPKPRALSQIDGSAIQNKDMILESPFNCHRKMQSKLVMEPDQLPKLVLKKDNISFNQYVSIPFEAHSIRQTQEAGEFIVRQVRSKSNISGSGAY